MNGTQLLANLYSPRSLIISKVNKFEEFILSASILVSLFVSSLVSLFASI